MKQNIYLLCSLAALVLGGSAIATAVHASQNPSIGSVITMGLGFVGLIGNLLGRRRKREAF
jgi:hypothetical protein